MPDTETMSDQIRFRFSVAGFDVAEFVEARTIVECAIMPIAVRRMTPSLLTQLENALHQIEMNADDPVQADRHDRDFHLLILKACGNRVLEVYSGVLLTYFEITSKVLASLDQGYFHEIARQQRVILNAIKADDPELAAQLLTRLLTEKAVLADRGSQTMPCAMD